MAVNEFLIGFLNFLKKLRFKNSRVSKSFIVGVGSPVLGGGGKTEIAFALYNKLKNLEPFILMKGYKGIIKRPTIVNTTQHSAKDVGDEAMMIALRGCRVAISHDKTEGIKFLEDCSKLIILDDCLQHRSTKMNFTVMVLPFDTMDSFSKILANKLFPFGFLRDDLFENSNFSDAIVIVSRNCEPYPKEFRKLNFDKPLYFAHYDFETPDFSEAVVVTSIARPESFVSALKSRNIKISRHFKFKDHHYFSNEELTMIERLGLPILTTEKDWVKIAPRTGSPLWKVVRVKTIIENEDNLIRQIVNKINTET
ncbi:MAG: tetraacyldisaccharide 4'-kinase [Deltaproteobacteria bacterium]|nr:tetraacyldisaccharide 4'-kinase [Deltaproteobacteria bacterium]